MSIFNKVKKGDSAMKFFRGDVYCSKYITAGSDGIFSIKSATPVERKDNILLVQLGDSPYFMDLLSAALDENTDHAKELIKKPKYDYGRTTYCSRTSVKSSDQYFVDNLSPVDPLDIDEYYFVRGFINKVCPNLIKTLDSELKDKIIKDNEIDAMIGL